MVHKWQTTPEDKKSASMLKCLHGIRFLSITWVVMGHAFQTAFIFPGANTYNLEENVSNTCLFIFKHNKN